MLKSMLTDLKFSTSREPKREAYVIKVEGLYEGKPVAESIRFLRQGVRALGGTRAARETVLDKLIVRILKGEI
jgi:hypothetical protein